MVSAYTKPLPRVDSISRPYWESARRHELRLQQCSACGMVRFPPKLRCPACLSPQATWELMSGRGRVWSWIEMHQQYFAGFKDELPYVVLWVQLDEGPMIMTNLVESDRSRLRCDAPVEVTFADVTDEVTLPQFRLT
jgi:uncharacterized OB-fold protein